MWRSETDYDVVIAGGGPAGLSTALHLAQASPALARRSVLLEAERHPRDKPCAGGATPGAMHYVRRLGVEPGSIPHSPVRDVRVRLGSSEVVVRGDPHCFDVVRRSEFDGALAACLGERRGPELLQDARVRSVRRRGDGFELQTDAGTLSCRALVAADGGSSVVRACLWPEPRAKRITGLECRVPATGVEAGEAIFDFSPLRSGILGYTWDFPTLGQERSVGIFAHVEPPLATSHLRERLVEMGVAAPGEIALHGARVPIFEPSQQFALPGVMLVGDAAGLDPLLGEGIGLALGQGEVAARNLIRGFAKDDLRFTAYRGELLRHNAGRCLVMRHRRYRVLETPATRSLLRPLWRLVVSVGEAATFRPA